MAVKFRAMLLLWALCAVGLAMRVRKEASLLTELAEVQGKQASTKYQALAEKRAKRRAATRAEQQAKKHSQLQAEKQGQQVQKREEIPIQFFDANPIGRGFIPGAYGLLMIVFGTGDSIATSDLRRVVIDRRFPDGFAFNGPRISVASRPVQPHFISQDLLEENPNFFTFSGKGTADVSTAAPPVAGGGQRIPFITASMENVFFIICPFLSTLINEGALPLQQVFSKERLMQATMDAGLPLAESEQHIAENFANNPEGMQDLWNMEGSRNEHVSSTGINDCETIFSNCRGLSGEMRCSSFTFRDCVYPDEGRFNDFTHALEEENGRITREFLDYVGCYEEEDGFPVFPNDEEREAAGCV